MNRNDTEFVAETRRNYTIFWKRVTGWNRGIGRDEH